MHRTSTLSFGHSHPSTGLDYLLPGSYYYNASLGSIRSTIVAPGSKSLPVHSETSITYGLLGPLAETQCPPSVFGKSQSEAASGSLSADICSDSVCSLQLERSNATAPLPMYSMVITTPWDPDLRYRFGTNNYKLSNNLDFAKKLVSVSADCLRLWYDDQRYSNQRAWKVSRTAMIRRQATPTSS